MSETSPVAAPNAIPDAAAADPAGQKASRKAAVKAWLYGYAAFYVVMFVLFFFSLATRAEKLSPQQWLERAGSGGLLSGWQGRLDHPDAHSADELAQLYAKRLVEVAPPGPPSAGEVRLIDAYSFSLPDGTRHTVESGQRLTRADVAALARAMVIDAGQGKVDANHKPMADLKVYKDSFLNDRDWNYILTIVNLIGFFLLVGLFLWGPLSGALGNMAGKAAQALERAQGAQAEAEEIKRKYIALQEEVATRREQNEKSAVSDVEEERARILESARHEAAALMEHLKASMDAEVAAAKEKIKGDVVRSALASARTALEQSVNEADHNAAVEAFIEDVGKTKV